MKWIVLTAVFFTVTLSSAETVITKTITDGVDDHRPPDYCRGSVNPYARESCEQIRQSDRVRNNPQDENNVTTVIQSKVVEPSPQEEMPAWQRALQPPATPSAPQK